MRAEGVPYTLLRLDPETFSLKNAANAEVHGPFSLAQGSPVALGQSAYTLSNSPPAIAGTVEHAGLLKAATFVCLIPFSGPMLQDLSALRAVYLRRKQALESETSPVQLEGVPSISLGSGQVRPTIIDRSARDIARAHETAVTTTETSLTRFLARHATRSAAVASGGVFRFTRLPPGRYAVCAVNKLKREAREQMAAELAIWWSNVEIADRSAEIRFTRENVLRWTELFVP